MNLWCKFKSHVFSTPSLQKYYAKFVSDELFSFKTFGLHLHQTRCAQSRRDESKGWNWHLHAAQGIRTSWSQSTRQEVRSIPQWCKYLIAKGLRTFWADWVTSFQNKWAKWINMVYNSVWQTAMSLNMYMSLWDVPDVDSRCVCVSLWPKKHLCQRSSTQTNGSCCANNGSWQTEGHDAGNSLQNRFYIHSLQLTVRPWK